MSDCISSVYVTWCNGRDGAGGEGFSWCCDC